MDKRKNIGYLLGRPKMRMRLDHDLKYGQQEDQMHDRVKKVDDNWDKWREERQRKKKGEV